MSKPNILVVLGSTRDGRMGVHVGNWLREKLLNRNDLEMTYVDLRELRLPMFGEEQAAIIGDWVGMIEKADGYIFITPEYNHGYPGVLKNAMDYALPQWAYKPAGFVSYSAGPFGGVRAVEQLRAVTAEMKIYGLRDGLHIPFVGKVFGEDGKLLDESLNTRVENFLKPVIYWSEAMKDDREGFSS